MFPSLARLRAFTFFLLLPPLVHSREEALFASSVTYCNPPETLLIQRFDIAFFPRNQSVSFNISAASVKENVNVSANLLLNVYGMNPVNFTLDLCSVLNGALCPLPTYNFTGADSLPLPESLGVNDRIPGIAFKIPDLEGFAQLTLTEIGTGDIKACVQATLSNGWSTHQSAVEWATAGFQIAALLSAIVHSVLPDSLAPFRFLDLFYLYQVIASSGFLNLNHPSLYRAFTLNFSWAVGLLPSSFQSSINSMRHHTGGRLADSTSSSAVGLINRRSSPYNEPQGARSALSLLARQAEDVFAGALGTVFKLRVALPTNAPHANLAQPPAVQGEVQTVTADSSNVLEAGIPIYTNLIHIGTANAFMTAFICSLIILAIALALLGIGYGILWAVRRCRAVKGRGIQFDYLSFVRAWLVRLGLIFLLPLLIFVFYQWTLKDSWLSVLLSVITFLCLLVFLVYPPYSIIRFVRRSGDPYELYSTSDPTKLTSLGPLYAQYRPERYRFFLVLLVVPFFRAIFISFASSSGLAQVILLLITEIEVLGLQVALRPHKTRGGDILGVYLSVTRVVAMGLLVAFVEQLAVKAIPRTIIGIILAVIWAVAVVVVILDLAIYHMLIPLVGVITGRLGREPFGSPLASEGSMLEKGSKKSDAKKIGPSQVQEGISPTSSMERITGRGRPLNPTPDQNIPLDPQILETYPISPTESISTRRDSEIPSLYSRDSGTITVGSLLPRRWSFSTGIASLGTGSHPASLGYNSPRPTGSRPQSVSQYSSKSQSRPQSHYSQQSYPSSPIHTPSTPGDHSEESANMRLEAIQELPTTSQASGLGAQPSPIPLLKP